MAIDSSSSERRICEFCGADNRADQVACIKCGLWKDHKYEKVSVERPSNPMDVSVVSPSQLRRIAEWIERTQPNSAFVLDLMATADEIERLRGLIQAMILECAENMPHKAIWLATRTGEFEAPLDSDETFAGIPVVVDPEMADGAW